MDYEKINELIKGIIENEFEHIQLYKEKNFSENDIEQKKLTSATDLLFEKLINDVPEEYRDLLENFYGAMAVEWNNYCRFYFKEGLRAGFTNLKFLESIKSIGSIL